MANFSSGSSFGDGVIEIMFGHQLYLHPTDSSLSIQIDKPLTGAANYGDWSRNVFNFVLTKHKIGFLNGTCKKEDFHPHYHDQWDCANALVLSWIFRSVYRDLARMIWFFTNASAAWSDLKYRFQRAPRIQIFALRHKISRANQGSDSISTYFNNLRSLWAELDSIIDLKIPDPASLAIIHTYFEDVKFYEFLMGLNDSYLAIRGQINEEAQHDHSSQSSIPQVSVDAIYSNTSNSSSSTPKKKFQDNCDYCGIRGHKKAECYKLHGFSKDFKFTRSKTQAHNAVQNTQYAQLIKLISGESSSTAIANVVSIPFAASSHVDSSSSQSTGPSTSNSGTVTDRTWIVDIGATNHITLCANGLHSISSLSNHVHMPNGNHASITHTENLSISPNLSLKNILLVPSFKRNLLSVHKLEKNSNCFVSFYLEFYLMQDISTGMGPYKVPTHQGHRYFPTVVDDYSRFT
ncbi:uncharacterized protein [Rutidosis leptorrhynchoides]|uniref:uncharacterized protein n=1 Tax=Rutidosis leptorrhynchoides TaxID=125765 RepID=UPI003A996F46